MYSIDDVLTDRFFYRFSGCEQPLNKMTSMMLFNPPGSGVVAAIRQNETWSSNGTEMNFKWRKEPLGVFQSVCNSINLKNPETDIVQSKCVTYADKIGRNDMPDSIAYVFTTTDRLQPGLVLDPPMILWPGTGILVYPDTKADINWTWGCRFEEQAIPV